MADDDKEQTLKFVEDYRSFPQLWDQNNKLYTNKFKRQDGLLDLATKYNMTVDGVKKKIKSLRSYFSKEHQKANKKKSGAGTEEIYRSPWFAYKYLLFTAASITPRSTKETTIINEIPADNLKDSHAETPIEEASFISQSTSFNSDDEHDFVQPPIRKKRNIKRTNDDDKENEAYNFMKKASENLTQKDEYTIYGQLVGQKIQKLNPCNRLIAQQRINNILFELEISQMNAHESNASNVSLKISSGSSSNVPTQDAPDIPMQPDWRLVLSDDNGCPMNPMVSEMPVNSQQLTDFENLSEFLQFKRTSK